MIDLMKFAAAGIVGVLVLMGALIYAGWRIWTRTGDERCKNPDYDVERGLPDRRMQ